MDGNSVFSAQFCCATKTSLENKGNHSKNTCFNLIEFSMQPSHICKSEFEFHLWVFHKLCFPLQQTRSFA